MLNLEERAHLHEAAASFACYTAERYPQVTREGQLIYHIGGSMAIILVSQAESMELLDPSQIPDIVIAETQPINEDARNNLGKFVRKVGDFDFVGTETYRKAQKLCDKYAKKDRAKHDQLKSKLLGKGGLISIDELPEIAGDIFRFTESQTKVACDPVDNYGTHMVARINLNGNNLYVGSPIRMFGYNVLYSMKKFRTKPEKFKRDFEILHSALSQMYTKEELINAAYSVISEHEDNNVWNSHAAKFMEAAEHNPEFKGGIKDFFEKLKQYDAERRKIMQPPEV